MKKIVALTCLLGALAFTAQAETKALIVNEANPEKSLTIEDGQVATVVFWGHNNLRNISVLKITIGDNSIEFSPDSFTQVDGDFRGEGGMERMQPDFTPVVPGPATITLIKKKCFGCHDHRQN